MALLLYYIVWKEHFYLVEETLLLWRVFIRERRERARARSYTHVRLYIYMYIYTFRRTSARTHIREHKAKVESCLVIPFDKNVLPFVSILYTYLSTYLPQLIFNMKIYIYNLPYFCTLYVQYYWTFLFLQTISHETGWFSEHLLKKKKD